MKVGDTSNDAKLIVEHIINKVLFNHFINNNQKPKYEELNVTYHYPISRQYFALLERYWKEVGLEEFVDDRAWGKAEITKIHFSKGYIIQPYGIKIYCSTPIDKH